MQEMIKDNMEIMMKDTGAISEDIRDLARWSYFDDDQQPRIAKDVDLVRGKVLAIQSPARSSARPSHRTPTRASHPFIIAPIESAYQGKTLGCLLGRLLGCRID